MRMQIRKLELLMSVICLAIFLVSNISGSFAYTDNQTQSNTTKKILITNCQWSGTCFSPCQVVILKGDSVTWVNTDNSFHIVASGDNQNGAGGWFSSSIIPPHGTFTFKFDRLESFTYFDILHPKAEGVVIVGNAIDSPQVHLQQSYFSNWCKR